MRITSSFTAFITYTSVFKPERKVRLGDSNFEYVEVVGGLEPGDEVVISDMSSFKEKNKLKLR